MATERPIATLIVGLGRSGWDVHAKLVAGNKHFKIVAVVDEIRERREEAADTYGCRTYAGLEEALSEGPTELAVIATRNAEHGAHALAALRGGCHTLVEKPPAMSVRELDKMIAAAKKAKRLLTFYQVAWASEPVRFVREVIDSKVLGEVFWVRHERMRFWRRNDWQTMKRYGGGLLYNTGWALIHSSLDLLDSPVKEAWGYLNRTVTAGDAEDFVNVMIVGKNRRLLEIRQSDGCALKGDEWLVCGTTGAVSVSETKATFRYFEAKLAPMPKVDARTKADRLFGPRDRVPWREITVEATPKKTYPDFYEALYKSIRKGKRLLVTAESVRESMRLMDLIRKQSGK